MANYVCVPTGEETGSLARHVTASFLAGVTDTLLFEQLRLNLEPNNASFNES
jgi:hypothetical protein